MIPTLVHFVRCHEMLELLSVLVDASIPISSFLQSIVPTTTCSAPCHSQTFANVIVPLNGLHGNVFHCFFYQVDDFDGFLRLQRNRKQFAILGLTLPLFWIMYSFQLDNNTETFRGYVFLVRIAVLVL